MKTIHIIEETMPFAWEKAVMACWEQGESFPTQYDKPSDPNSRDVVAMIHVTRPMSEPRIHRALPGGLADLRSTGGRCTTSCTEPLDRPGHGLVGVTPTTNCMFEYDVPAGLGDFVRHNQIDKCVQMLKACGYTRRAQAVTWKVWEDLGSAIRLLQRMWFRGPERPAQHGGAYAPPTTPTRRRS